MYNFSYINKMSIKRFNGLVQESKLKLKYYNEVPLKRFLGPLCKSKLLKEYTVKMVVAVLEKEA